MWYIIYFIMEIYLYVFIAILIVSLTSLVGVIAFIFSKRILNLLVPILVSVAVGAMLGDAFIHLIPEAFKSADNPLIVSLLIITGMLIFFILEKFLYWHHSHGEHDISEYHDCDHKDEKGCVRPVGRMVLISDGFHNFIDGMIIATGFIVSTPVGIATTIAVLLHEIPQELGDFGVLLHAGFSKKRALFVNFLSAILAFLGALIALVLEGVIDNMVQWIIPIAAGSFIYIATADLIPELHKTTEFKKSLIQFSAFLLGIVLMIILLFI